MPPQRAVVAAEQCSKAHPAETPDSGGYCVFASHLTSTGSSSDQCSVQPSITSADGPPFNPSDKLQSNGEAVKEFGSYVTTLLAGPLNLPPTKLAVTSLLSHQPTTAKTPNFQQPSRVNIVCVNRPHVPLACQSPLHSTSTPESSRTGPTPRWSAGWLLPPGRRRA